MTVKTRRIIMFSFIAAFFILAPTLIFYASGYRLDINRFKILKTGTLYVEAEDIKEAQLFINDLKHEHEFNEKQFIYNLFPGEYNIKLIKEGYYSWENKATIQSSLTTFARDIILFKKEVPLQIINGTIPDLNLSPDWQKIIYLSKTDSFTEIYYYNIDKKDSILLYRLPKNNQNISIKWAASSKKILLSIDQEHLVFDLANTKQAININELINFNLDKTKWDLNSDNIIYASTENSIYKIDLLAKKVEIVFIDNQNNIYPEFFTEASDVFYIKKSENNNSLYKYNLNFKTDKEILQISKSNNYKFIKSSNNYIGLIDLDLQKLYLIQKVITASETNISAEAPIKKFNAKDAHWDTNEKELIIYDDFEILKYNPATGQEEIINRYGQIIKKANWYHKYAYVIVLFDNKIEIIDLQTTNGSRNVTKIVSFENMNNFFADKKGENIYFNGEIGKQQGLYQIKIR